MPTKDELNRMAKACGHSSFKKLKDPAVRARIIALALDAKRNDLLAKLSTKMWTRL